VGFFWGRGAHTCNPSYAGHRGKRIWSEDGQGKSTRFHLKNKPKSKGTGSSGTALGWYTPRPRVQSKNTYIAPEVLQIAHYEGVKEIPEPENNSGGLHAPQQ
jgi:hypothetical protein